jgi:hypothetical protein
MATHPWETQYMQIENDFLRMENNLVRGQLLVEQCQRANLTFEPQDTTNQCGDKMEIDFLRMENDLLRGQLRAGQCQRANLTFEQQDTTNQCGAKTRKRRPKEKLHTADDCKLLDRETDALKILREGDITSEPWSLTLDAAIKLHEETDPTHTRDVRRALRVVTAMINITATSTTEKAEQLAVFTKRITNALKSLDINDVKKANEIRSVFLKACHHRVWPEKNENQANRQAAGYL